MHRMHQCHDESRDARHADAHASAAEPKPALRRGWLKNGNAPGDFHNCTRCGAKTRKGAPCRAPAMSNGRCRMHGGASTGPRTGQGRAQCAEAHTIHGLYATQCIDRVRAVRLSTRAKTIALDVGSRELIEVAASTGIDVSALATPEVLRLNVRKKLTASHRILTKLWSIPAFRSAQTARQRREFRRNLAEVTQKLASMPRRNRKPRRDVYE
jgi:hypothetical protein